MREKADRHRFEFGIEGGINLVPGDVFEEE